MADLPTGTGTVLLLWSLGKGGKTHLSLSSSAHMAVGTGHFSSLSSPSLSSQDLYGKGQG